MQKKCVAHREDVSLSPSSNAALPPTYPIRKEARNHSRSRNARKISNGCLNGNNRAQGCAELTIGSPVKVRFMQYSRYTCILQYGVDITCCYDSTCGLANAIVARGEWEDGEKKESAGDGFELICPYKVD